MKLMVPAIIATALTMSLEFCARPMKEQMISQRIESSDNVQKLFPHLPEEIKKDTDRYIDQSKKMVDAIIAIENSQRTFANTAKALDDLMARSDLAVKLNIFSVTEYLHPDKAMRDMAHDAIKKIEKFFVESVSNNKALYRAFKAYVQGNAHNEKLDDEQEYFLAESMKNFKRAGLDLPDEKLKKVTVIKKQLAELSLEFERNIADDNPTIKVSKKELAGLDDDFIASLKKTDDGHYILGVDYPTYFQVMDHSTVASTRKQLFETFANRAYPKNEVVLKKIITLRDELAKILGFESFSALNIDSQMAHTPQRVQTFLNDLRDQAQKKATEELSLFTRQLPPSVTLTSDGKINAWDMGRLKTNFKRQNFNIDERKIAEYFPMQNTIDQLLDVYRQFLGVSFKEVPIAGMWHDDVRLIEVYDKDNTTILGYLFLDLYPRPNKYSHAAHAGIIPAIQLPDGSRLPAVSVVMANFPKPSGTKPSLLMRSDVSTFFHEFGHAMHSILGATQLGSFAGTHVKTDFVEMPSQMLEEWLWDKDILKKISKHYQSGEPLPDDIIENIVALKRYDSGNFVTRQAMLAQYALDLYSEGADKSPDRMWARQAHAFLPHIYWGPNYRMYASFGHLTGYGAKYYGYLWSKVFALDLFDTIKKYGLLDAGIGTKYVRHIIGRGGSMDPNRLLFNFLGRKPSQKAFLKDMGFE